MYFSTSAFGLGCWHCVRSVIRHIIRLSIQTCQGMPQSYGVSIFIGTGALLDPAVLPLGPPTPHRSVSRSGRLMHTVLSHLCNYLI